MYDAELDFIKSVFKVVVYVKYEFKVFSFTNFLLVGGLCIWLTLDWSVVGGLKETLKNM